MTPLSQNDADMTALIKELQGQGKSFAIATLIRTSGATSAKPGARAVLLADGDIATGWIGSQCVKGALRTLAEQGIAPGDDLDGVQYARNGCPSKGSLDIFVEPFLPMPQLLVIGDSPVAEALHNLALSFDWNVEMQASDASIASISEGVRRMIVVATQGNGDFNGLKNALESQPEFISFVGSRRKFATLSEKLESANIAKSRIDQVNAPAGLAISAVTPQEIALSILAELTQQRRRNQRLDDKDPSAAQ